MSEEKKEIIPAIKYLIKKILKLRGQLQLILFLEKNIKNFDVVVGMYHDQVLIPAKTLYKFNAINITIGLPFLKITPDHGPNIEMAGKISLTHHQSIMHLISCVKLNEFSAKKSLDRIFK